MFSMMVPTSLKLAWSWEFGYSEMSIALLEFEHDFGEKRLGDLTFLRIH